MDRLINSELRADEIRVTVKDAQGKTYTRDWKSTANRIDAIRWTIESPDVPYYFNVAEIVGVTISTESPQVTETSNEE